MKCGDRVIIAAVLEQTFGKGVAVACSRIPILLSFLSVFLSDIIRVHLPLACCYPASRFVAFHGYGISHQGQEDATVGEEKSQATRIMSLEVPNFDVYHQYTVVRDNYLHQAPHWRIYHIYWNDVYECA